MAEMTNGGEWSDWPQYWWEMWNMMMLHGGWIVGWRAVVGDWWDF